MKSKLVQVIALLIFCELVSSSTRFAGSTDDGNSTASPCSLVDCQPNSVCKIFEPTGEPFCEPSCSINNGGCPSGQACSLEVVQCVRAPCPHVVRCTDPCDECTSEQTCRLRVAPCLIPPCPVFAECLEPEEVCSLSPDPGRCMALFRRFFYNATSGQCERFVYGGCGGNQNNFETPEECESRCKEPAGLRPTSTVAPTHDPSANGTSSTSSDGTSSSSDGTSSSSDGAFATSTAPNTGITSSSTVPSPGTTSTSIGSTSTSTVPTSSSTGTTSRSTSTSTVPTSSSTGTTSTSTGSTSTSTVPTSSSTGTTSTSTEPAGATSSLAPAPSFVPTPSQASVRTPAVAPTMHDSSTTDIVPGSVVPGSVSPDMEPSMPPATDIILSTNMPAPHPTKPLPSKTKTVPTSTASEPVCSNTPPQPCSYTKTLSLSLGVSIPCTAILAVLVTSLVFFCCQKAKKKSSYIRMAPTVYFDEEEQD